MAAHPPPKTERLYNAGASTTIVAFTDWELGIGVDTISAALHAMSKVAVSGNTLAKLACQTAEVRIDDPGDWQLIDDLLVTNNEGNAVGSLSVSALTAGKMWVRWGVGFYMSSTGAGSADLMLQVATVAKGMIVGSWRGHVMSTVATDTVQAVTGFVPVAWAAQVFAAVIHSSAGANLQSQLYYRTAEFSQDVPGSWTLITNTATTGTDEGMVSNTSLSLGANMWVQFGIGYQSTSGTSSGDIAITVAVRRA